MFNDLCQENLTPHNSPGSVECPEVQPSPKPQDETENSVDAPKRRGRPKGVGKGLRKWEPVPMAQRIETFWSLVDKNGPNGCWVWMGTQIKSKNKQPYGKFSINGGEMLAHRFSWLITHGELPSKPYLCHTCDFGLCVNPAHLFPGTALDNNRDAIQKGRVRHWGRPKITPELVLEIRELYATGQFTYTSLAEQLKLPRTQIFSALHKWKTLYGQIDRQKSPDPERPALDRGSDRLDISTVFLL